MCEIHSWAQKNLLYVLCFFSLLTTALMQAYSNDCLAACFSQLTSQLSNTRTSSTFLFLVKHEVTHQMAPLWVYSFKEARSHLLFFLFILFNLMFFIHLHTDGSFSSLLSSPPLLPIYPLPIHSFLISIQTGTGPPCARTNHDTSNCGSTRLLPLHHRLLWLSEQRRLDTGEMEEQILRTLRMAWHELNK